MKFIQKSRIEIFLKTKGYNVETIENHNEETKNADYWSKSKDEKIIVPKKDILGSNELSDIFKDDNLLKEFRKY
jgi:hypothetical protein